jgi:hypothetical protein
MAKTERLRVYSVPPSPDDDDVRPDGCFTWFPGFRQKTRPDAARLIREQTGRLALFSTIAGALLREAGKSELSIKARGLLKFPGSFRKRPHPYLGKSLVRQFG